MARSEYKNAGTTTRNLDEITPEILKAYEATLMEKRQLQNKIEKINNQIVIFSERLNKLESGWKPSVSETLDPDLLLAESQMLVDVIDIESVEGLAKLKDFSKDNDYLNDLKNKTEQIQQERRESNEAKNKKDNNNKRKKDKVLSKPSSYDVDRIQEEELNEMKDQESEAVSKGTYAIDEHAETSQLYLVKTSDGALGKIKTTHSTSNTKIPMIPQPQTEAKPLPVSKFPPQENNEDSESIRDKLEQELTIKPEPQYDDELDYKKVVVKKVKQQEEYEDHKEKKEKHKTTFSGIQENAEELVQYTSDHETLPPKDKVSYKEKEELEEDLDEDESPKKEFHGWRSEEDTSFDASDIKVKIKPKEAQNYTESYLHAKIAELHGEIQRRTCFAALAIILFIFLNLI